MTPKHFTSMEGGYVATNDRKLAEMLRLTGNYGVLPNYNCVSPGLNARMPEINAIIGGTLLPHIEELVEQRNQHAAVYKELLGELPGLW